MTAVICPIISSVLTPVDDRYLRDKLEELVHQNMIFFAVVRLLDCAEEINVSLVGVGTLLSIEARLLVFACRPVVEDREHLQ